LRKFSFDGNRRLLHFSDARDLWFEARASPTVDRARLIAYERTTYPQPPAAAVVFSSGPRSWLRSRPSRALG
jgi:hypothetical protein